ncbi:MAG: phosphotransferase family protein [Acidimicrobiia bacterium]|nr:phosphotransferase family protein [Acidimicrobiia bacterium]
MLPEDVIEVRPDERFDEDRLHAYLRDRLPHADGSLTVQQFSGGHANLTYLLTFDDGAMYTYVLRRPPLGPVAPGAHDMSREHSVLSRLWTEFDKAPRSRVYCEDPSILGAPFFVMDRRDGIVVRKEVPAVFGGGADPTSNRRLSEVVIDTLAEFHGVDPAAAGLDELGRPDGFLARQVEGWAKRWHASKHEDVPLADELIAWLSDHLPESPDATLIHNDWRLDNMAVSPDDPGVCVAVYDWDMCTRGDPLADLGTVLSVWYDDGEIPATLNPMPTFTPGFMSRAEAIDRYASLTGTEPSSIGYYVTFGSFKMAVILQQIYIRYVRGQTHDERFAGMGDAARHLLELAASRRA